MNILIVDDSLVIRSIQKAMSKKLQPQSIHSTSTGQEALDQYISMVEEGLQDIVVLMDINMPGIDGIETLRRIRKFESEKIGQSPLAHIIMITAHRTKENQELAKKYGADDFMGKPIVSAVIKKKLKAIEHRPIEQKV